MSDVGDVSGRTLRQIAEASEHLYCICFKTGPPRRLGVELEWTTHLDENPAAPLSTATLGRALGPHAPAAFGNPDPVSLPAGGVLTAEPGGQIEISSAPATSLTELHTAVSQDRAYLADLLARSRIHLGDSGLDPYRPPVRLLNTPRYAAMHRAFGRDVGAPGHTMMCSTAGLQVCLDAGDARSMPARWSALHDVGPPLLATFATSRMHAGRDTGWASGRMAAWYGLDARRSGPVPSAADPAAAWSEYALAAPLLCVRRSGGRWETPEGVTFADWIGGALPRPPTVDDLDYHLSTLFPPVRPRGYLEVRYLDTQPGDEWIAPAAVLTALLAGDDIVDAARNLAQPAAGRWVPAARDGLTDPLVATCAADLIDLACRHLDRTGLPMAVCDQVTAILDRRLHRAVSLRKDPLP
ncbi:ergothioneine biosynthesis glutamate--cysteine ligase EgtA [Mangrovihabitans endophyticus]|uniref:Glutamate--cysteine ligase EgtA n=1 Tax=Mangrovihabitans endophyticus TaxID=1751298 RepID=A0A8J3C813_9ACTN|nr:ergothioneine biosynthesis glutamate--cysteine ligase EgtA [Mangrovihabitans endophyticus]GGL20578.1 glutamate--cysteine ligase EgtA [Mangrovihabitans endophyticus]